MRGHRDRRTTAASGHPGCCAILRARSIQGGLPWPRLVRAWGNGPQRVASSPAGRSNRPHHATRGARPATAPGCSRSSSSAPTPAEHRARVEGWATDISGLELPTGRDVVEREYEPWDRDHLVIDTAARPWPNASP